MLVDTLVKALAAGVLVVVLAAIGEALRPKGFAGLFSAAPSIALASLIVTGYSKGASADHDLAMGMSLGAVALALCCLLCVVTVRRWRAVRGSLAGVGLWLVCAAIAAVFLR